VAEYLLAEVLERQSEEVRQLLLRSWIGEAGLGASAAWVLVGRGERDPQRFWLSVLGALRQTSPGRILEDLKEANAFVVALNAVRSWFRYHRLFAGLLQRELRRAAPGDITALHTATAAWYAGHGLPFCWVATSRCGTGMASTNGASGAASVEVMP
jgi:LuxR family maltose regulon positive regulatory protein